MNEQRANVTIRRGFEPPSGAVVFGVGARWGGESPAVSDREPRGNGFKPPGGGRIIEQPSSDWAALVRTEVQRQTAYRGVGVPLTFGAAPQPPAQLQMLGAYVQGDIMPAAPLDAGQDDPSYQRDPSGNAIAALALGLLSFVFCAGWVLSIPTFLLARSELKRIGQGYSPRSGEIYAQAGLALAVTSFVVSSIVFGMCGSVWVYALLEEFAR